MRLQSDLSPTNNLPLLNCGLCSLDLRYGRWIYRLPERSLELLLGCAQGQAASGSSISLVPGPPSGSLILLPGPSISSAGPSGPSISLVSLDGVFESFSWFFDLPCRTAWAISLIGGA